MKWEWVTWILVILAISVLLRLIKKKYVNPGARIKKNGFQVLSCFTENETQYLLQNFDDKDAVKSYIHNNQNVLRQVQEILGPSYVFQDYVFLIEKSRFHTCHRDVNSKYFNEKQKHPSYTIIFFLEPMKRCLDVIDSSHTTRFGVFLTDETESIPCVPGDAILFDASLIHAGAKNDKPNNKRIQMKLTHVDDVQTLDFFQDYNKKLSEDNNNPEVLNDIQKHMSCQFTTVTDIVKSSAPKSVENLFGSLFYGNSNFYNLKTV